MPTKPLATLRDGRAPVISSGYGPRVVIRDKRKVRVHHDGADLAYRALPSDPPAKVVRGRVVYTPQRTRLYYADLGGRVYATEDGVVVAASKKPLINGDVWIHHPETGRVTRYAHLSRIGVKVGDQVREGQPIGIVGAGARTPFVHLHFELLSAGKPGSQVDPADYLARAKERTKGPAGNPDDGGATRPANPNARRAAAGTGGMAWLLVIGALLSRRS